MTTTTELPEIIKTVMAPGLRRNGAVVTPHRECWEAETTDGVWLFVRLDGVPGTPWTVEHRPTAIELDWCPSLRRCREYVAKGWAQDALERLQAHGRGEHDAERVPMCRSC